MFSASTRQVIQNTRLRIFFEYRASSVRHTVVFALLGLALWGEDWALDAEYAKYALLFRAGVAALLLLAALVKFLSKSIPLSYAATYLALALGEAALVVLSTNQQGGLALGAGQYLYFLFGSVLLCGHYPTKANLVGCIVLALIPNGLGALLSKDFPHIVYASLLAPACAICVLSHWRLRALLVENIRWQQELEASVLIDPATGLMNLRGLTHAFQRLIRLGETKPLQQFLLLIEIDGVDKIKAEHGEAFADTLLRKVGETIDISCRGRDITATPGEDAIVCILQNVSREKAFDIAERFRATIADKLFDGGEAEVGPIKCTVSIGLVFADTKQDIKSLLNHARIACNQAGSLGGNQCVCL